MMDIETSENISIGLIKAGDHIGSGIAWLGFWLFLGMAALNFIPG